MVQTKRFFHKLAFESCIMTRETIWQWHSSDNGAYKRQSTLDLQQTTREPGGVAPRDSGFPPLWQGGGGGVSSAPRCSSLPFFKYTPFLPLSRTWTAVLQDETAVHGCDCRGVMVVRYVRYCHIAELIHVPQCWNCYSVQGVPLGFSPAMGRPPCDKSGEARQTDCKLHLSINCKRPKVAAVSGWNFLKQLKEKDSQINESNFIPLD